MRHCRKDRWLRVPATAALSSSPHLLSDSDSVAVRPCLQHQRLSFNDNSQEVMINYSISCKTAAYQDATRNSKASLKEGQRNQLLQGSEWIGAAESNITQTSKQSNKKNDCQSHSKTLSVKRRHSLTVVKLCNTLSRSSRFVWQGSKGVANDCASDPRLFKTGYPVTTRYVSAVCSASPE
jgi:hypothetical protein